MEPQVGVLPTGPYTAWSTPEGMRSEIRGDDGKVIKRLRGETSWSDAVREAGDMNARARSKEVRK